MAVDAASAIHHPLHINLHGQTQILLSKLAPANPHKSIIAAAQSNSEILQALSNALSHPALTLLIESLFRPILFDLFCRWISQPLLSEDQLVAICLLLEIHEEIFPIMHNLLARPALKEGPLLGTQQFSSYKCRVNRLLLAYYRILQANRELPSQLLWPLSHLSTIIWDTSYDNASHLLAIRCYSLQSGMGEVERVKIEEQVLGKINGVECPLYYSDDLDGSSHHVDGWIMPVLEVRRIQASRREIATTTSLYFSDVPSLLPRDLCSFVADIEGVFLLRSSSTESRASYLIKTPTTQHNLRILAHHLSLRLPILLTSSPSAGKSILLEHLATQLYPNVQNQITIVHLADTSLDPRSLIGSYVSSTSHAGTFQWKEGVLVRAMRQGKWIVFKDIDRGSPEVLGVLKPLVESVGITKWIGGCASLDVPGRGKLIAHQNFAIFATRSTLPSRNGVFVSPLFFGAHKFSEVIVSSPSPEDLQTVIGAKFPKLAGAPTSALISLWEGMKKATESSSSMRSVGLRELEKFCVRVDSLLPASFKHDDACRSGTRLLSSIFPSTHLREQVFIEARDVFFGAAALTTAAQAVVDNIIAVVTEHLGLESERRDWLLCGWSADLKVEKDINDLVVGVRSGNIFLPSRSVKPGLSRPFAMHKPAISLMSRIITAISLREPVLLTGETGTGKTSVITYLSSLLRRPLISLNLSHQTESSDLLGGFRPVDARVPASMLQERFLDLFGATFSRRKNEKFETEVRKAVSDGKWKRAAGLWKESARMARERIRAKAREPPTEVVEDREATKTTRKRRKVDDGPSNTSEANWNAFEHDVGEFVIHHVLGKSKFAFDFVEGPLVKAVRSGAWVLLDEINLASSETLECISSLLHSHTSSITLTEQGSLEPIPRHPDFRLFACMNPATDVGKKDLTPNIRCRFTEIDVPAPDVDQDTLISIVTQYIGQVAVGDRAAILNVAEFYVAVKQLSYSRTISDAANHRPHYSMRTLARALTFAADTASVFGLRRAIWEGCLMAFTMILDARSSEVVTALAQKHLLAGVRNVGSLLSKIPLAPADDAFVKLGPFFLQKGPLTVNSVDEYVLTPSVEAKLVDLARIILTRRFPVLIEGPTSSGKTSSVEYLAKKTGHKFVRINNHEHTDIQEYLGSYVADPITGKLVFQDGLLVRALRNGDWIVLDELNLAPTDVLEALNRLLDDNRELIIPETQEVVTPHPHFMIFATQNPPGLYAGRKVLSRAFRNRFLEVHFEDVPEAELETILCQRCLIAPSYGKKIVTVFRELQNRRQSGRVFESKFGFATLRDLFRWAGRDAISYQELADNGYMLLAERARHLDDKAVVKEVIEKVMGVKIDEGSLYNIYSSSVDVTSFLGCPLPKEVTVIWTSAMRRLFVLLARALRFNEPVLLVGDTGCGKTSVCQLFALATEQHLHSLNCHQGTETADLIGGLRPIRNRASLTADVIRDASLLLRRVGQVPDDLSLESLSDQLKKLRKSDDLDQDVRAELEAVYLRLGRLNAIFEWHNGPLVQAMEAGDIFLLDEISLADDSVLERLNSVLESSRTLVLAEKGGDNTNDAAVTASDAFKLVATMNPGGDYGKKELSPALRNRFTEIWVPSVDSRSDLELIISRMWKHDDLKAYTGPLLDFVDWLCGTVSDRSIMNLRDLLAWVDFSNSVADSSQGISSDDIFHHAAHMTYIDGLGSMTQLSGYSKVALLKLKTDAIQKLCDLIPVDNESRRLIAPLDSTRFLQLGVFAVLKGNNPSSLPNFTFGAPTTNDNAARVIRACQLPKPLLLEGSPGVGKTSLITALSIAAGHHLCRINLSDQSDLADLFGSDLPVEGGKPGEFAWKNAEFLNALVEGHWVLLDEMNLAPQAVLEGLNSVLDHRGTVFIPELGRSFTRHPLFRIFAAQNPLNQGSGRKGLPKSFLNRFTKVYVDELTPTDLQLVCRHIFPHVPANLLQSMVLFNTTLNEEVNVTRTIGREGSPWEFNLRDVIRWGTSLFHADAKASLRAAYLHRFRTIDDRARACSLFETIFQLPAPVTLNPTFYSSPEHCQIGLFHTSRHNFSPNSRAGRVLNSQLTALEAVGMCINYSWLSILTGGRDTGKSHIIRLLAHLTGNELRELSLSSATEATDILGSFEQVDASGRLIVIIADVLSLAYRHLRTRQGSRTHLDGLDILEATFSSKALSHDYSFVLSTISRILVTLVPFFAEEVLQVHSKIDALALDAPARFEWFDGPLVSAMKDGHWLVMDGANLCSPSVLDRLNSVCETEGCLTLNERGHVDGEVVLIKPHPNFRLFMTVDPQYGELSRAMRNRGIEVALFPSFAADDHRIMADFCRTPSSEYLDKLSFDERRRGLSSKPSGSVSSGAVSSGFSLGTDSPLSYLLDRFPVVLENNKNDIQLDAVLSVIGRSQVPAFRSHVIRFIGQLNSPASNTIIEFLDRYPGPGETILNEMRLRYSVTREVPLASILMQPMMFFDFENSFGSDIKVLRDRCLRVLDICALLLRGQSDEPESVNLTVSELHQTTQRDIIVLCAHLQEVSLDLLHAPPEGATDMAEYDLALEGLQCMHAFRNAVRGQRIDYSSIYALVMRMKVSLQNSPLCFDRVSTSLSKLADTIYFSSSFGLSQLWSAFWLMPRYNVTPAAMALNAIVCVPGRSNSDRRHAFTLLSLTLTGKCDDSMLQQTIGLSRSTITVSEAAGIDIRDTILLTSELGVISGEPLNPVSLKTFLEVIRDLSDVSLIQAVPYQELLWIMESDSFDVHACQGILVQQQLRWMINIWVSSLVDGPSSLLRPNNLLALLSHCNSSNTPLSAYADYEQVMQRDIKQILLQCNADRPRTKLLAGVVRNSFAMVSRAFTRADTNALMSGDHLSFQDTKRVFMEPALLLLDKPPLSREGELLSIGNAWLSVARMVLSLAVPSVPVDPAGIQDCAYRFVEDRISLLSEQITLHLQLEALSTGNPRNAMTDYLEEQRQHLHSVLPSKPRVKRQNLSRLHMFWSEVTQFQNVVSVEKIDHLLQNLRAKEALSVTQEESLQKMIHNFIQRLETAYAEFDDLVVIIRFALEHLRFGLRIVRVAFSETPTSSDGEQCATALVSFPTIGAVSHFLGTRAVPQGVDLCQHHLLGLSAIALERSTKVLSQEQTFFIRDSYDCIVRLWLLDQEKAKRAEEQSQSLYRHKDSYIDVSDEARNEEEFRAMFPAFEEVLDDQSPDTLVSTPQGPLMVSPTQMNQLLDLHYSIIGLTVDNVANAKQYHAMRMQAISALPLHSLSEALDDHRIFQLRLLEQCLSDDTITNQASTTSGNFYLDQNVAEVQNAVLVVNALRVRLMQLIGEWPDQMVLHHLKDRCDALLALGLNSPLARVLSGLEQLLLQTEDWELFANRTNNLRPERTSLIELIVSWRRMELSCWDSLLGSEYHKFQSGVSEWWFRLYDSVIRGSLDALARDTDGANLGTDYLATLLPLLDGFLRDSPLGQFESRLNLIGSFERYCVEIVSTLNGSESGMIRRVQRILRTTWETFNLYSPAISLYLREQRSSLEREVKNFIKLASWKDINVQALKQSALRTHHQLYKIIRKFRDILRQPAAHHILAHLAFKDHDDIPLDSVLRTYSPTSHPVFPVREIDTASSHLVRLGRTYTRFKDIINDRIRGFVLSALPHQVENLSVAIIGTSERLSSSQVPNDLSAEKRTKYAKSLLTQKRKAWSDLLKELKRAGFATSLTTETLRNHQDSRWYREHAPLPSCGVHFAPLLRKSENYFYRLEESLKDLRNSVPTHHPDLMTRELQRGLIFLESCFGMAVESRSRLSASLNDNTKLVQSIRRLHMLAEATGIAHRGQSAVTFARNARDILCRLSGALAEGLSALQTLERLDPDLDLKILQRTTNESASAIQGAIREMDVVVENVGLSSFPVLLSDEHQVIEKVLALVDKWKASINDMSHANPHSREIFAGIFKWLTEQPLPSIAIDGETDIALVDPDILVDACLVKVQNILTKCDCPVGDEDDREHYIRCDYVLVHDMTRILGVDGIVRRLDDLFRSSTRLDEFSRLLPFLDQYQNVVLDQLTCHAAWTKSLFKMSHVLCSLLRTLCKDGFCKPPDGECGAGEDAAGTTDGLGMGDGTGSANVSKEIEEESQVEGLRGEEEDGDGDNEDDDAIEMADDFGGDMKDLPGKDEESSEAESDDGPDEMVGDLDAQDPDAVDEKLWGDDQGPEGTGEDEKTDKDHSTKESENSEIAAKEQNEQGDGKEKERGADDGTGDQEEEVPEEQVAEDNDPAANGLPLDEHLPEADTLDLPDDIDLSKGDDADDEKDKDLNLGDDQVSDDAEMQDIQDLETEQSVQDDERDTDTVNQDDADDQTQEGEQGKAEATEDDSVPTDEASTLAPPDVRSGNDNMQSDDQQDGELGENASGGSSKSAGGDTAQENDTERNASGLPESIQTEPNLSAPQDDGENGAGTQQGQQPQTQAKQSQSDPLRSLGDALKEARQMFNDILNNEHRVNEPVHTEKVDQLEYLRPDDQDVEMHALGPAEDEQTAKLRDLKLLDDEQEPNDDTPMEVDTDIAAESAPQSNDVKEQAKSSQQAAPQENIEGAILSSPSKDKTSTINSDLSAPTGDLDMEVSFPDEAVEVQLRQWHAAGAPAEGAEHIWRLYESLTHDLAYALCEQLRLILEPTLATRLKGDYRTGKRLNMKKIIPYIASDYTKDKIWLRRTRPSQREYQILIALDDSRSMSESHSVHLAYQTMALVSKALTRLEVGDIGFVKFGESVDVLHGFTDGPFTDQTGMKVMSAFTFDQKATNVLSLVDRSLQVLEKARESRSTGSSSAADLWQLQVIISDGICQDHEQLRSVLRKAEEQRVMIVFIIIDSLDSQQGSIFTMEKAEFQNVDGRVELKLNRYLDSFPFEYYVVLRDVEALPGVFATTLKQFFEYVSQE